jgi:UDP-glucose 4-epimerase
VSKENKKAILVTGGAGYVGSRVAEILAQSGNPVVAVDIVTPEERGIEFSKNILFLNRDLRNPDEADEACKGMDVVLHFAADIGALNYMHEHQADIIKNNAAIDAALYPAMVKNKVKWVVYSSSSMVFQYPPKFPYTESDLTKLLLPTNIYGFSKLAGEYFCKAYSEQYSLPYTILRYHNIYGPGEDSKGSLPGDIHVIPALLGKVLGGQYPLEFLGDPTATRPFTYIDDAVDATIKIARRAVLQDKSVRNEDFNVGNDVYYTILELGKIIWQLFGDDREFSYTVVKTSAVSAHWRQVDITKIRDYLGWEPRVSLEEGLQKTAEWIKDRNTKAFSIR